MRYSFKKKISHMVIDNLNMFQQLNYFKYWMNAICIIFKYIIYDRVNTKGMAHFRGGVSVIKELNFKIMQKQLALVVTKFCTPVKLMISSYRLRGKLYWIFFFKMPSGSLWCNWAENSHSWWHGKAVNSKI